MWFLSCTPFHPLPRDPPHGLSHAIQTAGRQTELSKPLCFIRSACLMHFISVTESRPTARQTLDTPPTSTPLQPQVDAQTLLPAQSNQLSTSTRIKEQAESHGRRLPALLLLPLSQHTPDSTSWVPGTDMGDQLSSGHLAPGWPALAAAGLWGGTSRQIFLYVSV